MTAALAEVEARFTRARATVYDRLIRLVGFRLKPPPAGPDGLAILADGQGALMTGLVVRERTAPPAPVLTCAPFGSSREGQWPVPAFHLVHGLLSHLEPDPDITWTPPGSPHGGRPSRRCSARPRSRRRTLRRDPRGRRAGGFRPGAWCASLRR